MIAALTNEAEVMKKADEKVNEKSIEHHGNIRRYL